MEIIHLPLESANSPKILKPNKDKELIFKEIYDEVQVLSKTPKSEKPVKRVQTPDRIVLSTPQINRLAYDKLDSNSRSRMIQAVCESPGVLTLFHKNKLFVKGKDENSKFITSSLPIQTTNRSESFHSKSKKVLNKTPKLKFSYLAKDFETTMNRIKTVNSCERTSRSRLVTCRSNNIKNDLCLALSSIEQQCELSRKTANQANDGVASKKQRKMKVWTDRVHWTASRLQKWADLGNDVVRELFDYEVYVKESERSDAQDINKDLMNKSSHEVRDQAKFIKKILIKKKMKIL